MGEVITEVSVLLYIWQLLPVGCVFGALYLDASPSHARLLLLLSLSCLDGHVVDV